jgi:hypothetical protein
MPGILMVTNGHTLEVQLHTYFTATEIVRYDGVEKSRRSSLLGMTHTFEVTEDGTPVRYDVTTYLKWHGAGCRIQRNGQLIFSHT